MFGLPALFPRRTPRARGPTLQAKLKPGQRLEQRASAIGRILFIATGGQIVRSEIKYEDLAREGYEANPVVYRCISLIGDALKSMPTMIMKGEADVTATHPLALVLSAPNPDQVWEELIDAMVGHLCMAGEVFLEGVALTRGELAEIYALRPDKMSPEPGPDGQVKAYVYEGEAGQRKWPAPPKPDAFRPIMHLKKWHPRNHWRGFAPLLPAASAGDEHNHAVAYAKALYRNSARPSGALTFEPKDGPQNLTDEDRDALIAQLEERYQGPDNAGRPLVLDGGLKWQAMGFSPRDMEAGEGRNAAAREIAFALGVPPLMLGIKGDNTFANYEEANLAFWRFTVWPLAALLSKKLTAWVRPLYGPDIAIRFDQDGSPIAEAEKRERWGRVKEADFLTLDEKRAELGFDPLPNGEGEHVLVNASQAPLRDVLDGAGGDPSAYGDLGNPSPPPRAQDGADPTEPVFEE